VTDLKGWAAVARQEGWASGHGDVDSIRKQGRSLSWEEVAPRRGDPTVSVLHAVTADAAHASSLSSTCGLGQQPLHTDGAHLREPPDIVVLIAQRVSPTATRTWRCGSRLHPRLGLPAEAARHGMFLVRAGRDSFYAPVLAGRRYRYDPGCMSPCDARAREAAQYFAEQLENATIHAWRAAGQVLVIDNSRAMHARSAVVEGDFDRELIRIAFRAEVPK
jgi:hypothetical protein